MLVNVRQLLIVKFLQKLIVIELKNAALEGTWRVHVHLLLAILYLNNFQYLFLGYEWQEFKLN